MVQARNERFQATEIDDLLGDLDTMEFMLRFTISHPDLHTTIVGTKNADHLAANLAAAAKGPLPPDVYEAAKERFTRRRPTSHRSLILVCSSCRESRYLRRQAEHTDTWIGLPSTHLLTPRIGRRPAPPPAPSGTSSSAPRPCSQRCSSRWHHAIPSWGSGSWSAPPSRAPCSPWWNGDPRSVGVRPVVVAIAIVFVVAVAMPPRSSNDLWSYTMYGRTVAIHDANPYQRVPADFASDPFLERVSPIWQHRSSVFGPLWVGYATVGVSVAGDSPLLDRLFFQLTAAFAAAATLLLVWRGTGSSVALVWLGLHPVFGAVAVNGGHNDLLIGLALLGAVVLLTRRRPLAAGIVVGLAALIKLTALLALVGVVVWAWRHRERRAAGITVAASAATVALGYAPVLSPAWHVLSGADRTVTPSSLWNPLVDVMLGHNSFRDVANPTAPNQTLIAISYVSLACVAVLAVAVGWRAARSERIAPAVGVSTAAYPFAAEYAYPWYACWALPLFAERDPSPLAWVVWTQAAVMLAVYRLPIHWQGTPLDGLLRILLTYVAPVGLLVLFVVARPSTRSAVSPPELRRQD